MIVCNVQKSVVLAHGGKTDLESDEGEKEAELIVARTLEMSIQMEQESRRRSAYRSVAIAPY